MRNESWFRNGQIYGRSAKVSARKANRESNGGKRYMEARERRAHEGGKNRCLHERKPHLGQATANIDAIWQQRARHKQEWKRLSEAADAAPPAATGVHYDETVYTLPWILGGVIITNIPTIMDVRRSRRMGNNASSPAGATAERTLTTGPRKPMGVQERIRDLQSLEAGRACRASSPRSGQSDRE